MSGAADQESRFLPGANPPGRKGGMSTMPHPNTKLLQDAYDAFNRRAA
jgi:hypothetical protein